MLKKCVYLLLIMMLAMAITSCSKQPVDIEENNLENPVTEQVENEEGLMPLDNDDIYYTDDGNLATDSEWVEDQLFVLAANEIGVERLENCAADATTVKYLITEPDEMNAWLTQYAILYEMQEKEYGNMEVKFVFYKERGDVGTKYLQTSYSIETLETLNLDEMSSYLDLANYTD